MAFVINYLNLIKAEHAIYLVKRKLYLLMRSEKTQNWVKLLPIAVGLLNKRPLKRIGNLAPGSINTMMDDIKVREAQQETCQPVYVEQNYKDQNKLQAEYEQSKNYQVNDFVYLDYKEKTFSKSFNPKLSINIFNICSCILQFALKTFNIT